MKKFFILACCILGLLVAPNSYSKDDPKDNPFLEMDEIDIHGSLAESTVRDEVEKPIMAYSSTDCLKINFFSTLGNIGIYVYDGLGNTVHHSNVNIVSGQVVTVGYDNWVNGYYMLKILKLATGEQAIGTFEVKCN